MNVAKFVNIRGVYFEKNTRPTETIVDIRASTKIGRLVIPRTVSRLDIKTHETYQGHQGQKQVPRFVMKEVIRTKSWAQISASRRSLDEIKQIRSPH